MPPHWNSYVTVGDIHGTVEKTKALNGAILQEPFDVFESGRMAVIQDPTGAALALWQPKNDIGAHYKNVPGSLCWNELVTTDSERAKTFFDRLFDWESQTNEMIGIFYTVFLIEETPVAGMYQRTENMGDVPSHWLPYFAVENCDKTCSSAQEMGAVILQPPTDIPDTGRIAVLQDPQGTAFGIIRLEPMETE